MLVSVSDARTLRHARLPGQRRAEQTMAMPAAKRALTSPIDVELAPGLVVQPDIFVVPSHEARRLLTRCRRASSWWRLKCSASRPAYRHTAEDSVYVADAFHGRGIGRSLLEQLIARCEVGEWRQLVAIIGDSANAASIGLHAALGFRLVGTLYGVGFKFDRWVDTVVMQRELAPRAKRG